MAASAPTQNRRGQRAVSNHLLALTDSIQPDQLKKSTFGCVSGKGDKLT